MSKAVKCIKDAYRDGELMFKKGKEYPVTTEGKVKKTVNEKGSTEVYDPTDSNQAKIFNEYFKEV